MPQQEFIRLLNHWKLGKADGVLVAVSGGRDSMTLLHLFKKYGYYCEVAHVNHGLRGADSDEDERLVRDFSVQHALTFHNTKISETFWPSANKGKQEAARTFRYQWLAQLAEQRKLKWIATAHHHDDSVETMLMQVCRGGRYQALASIPWKRGNIIRPLINATRNAITHYAEQEAIPYRDDQSNEESFYARNAFRNIVIPAWKKRWPTFDNGFAIIQRRAQEVVQTFERVWEKLLGRDVYGRLVLDYNELKSYAAFEGLIQYGLGKFGFHKATIQQVMMSLESKAPRVFAGSSWQLLTGQALWILTPMNCFAMFGPQEIDLSQGRQQFQCGPWEVHLEVNGKAEQRIAWSGEKLLLRPWQLGDRMRPRHWEKGSRKLSDLLPEKGVDRLLRRFVPVISSGNEVLAIPGFETDARHQATNAPSYIAIATNPLALQPNFTNFVHLEFGPHD